MLNKQRGSFLLEALVSLLILMGGLLALVSAATTSINQVSQSKYRNDASNLSSEFIGEMYATWSAAQACPGAWGTRIAATLPGGVLTTCDTANWPEVSLKISWNDKNSTPHFYSTTTVITK